MKRHTSLILTAGLCLLALFSCKPVELPEPLQRTPVVDKPVIYVTPHAKTAEVYFTLVQNADDYDVSLQEGDDGPIEEQHVVLSMKQGLKNFKLKKLVPDSTYILTVTASNPAGRQSESVRFTTTSDNGEIEYAPLAYMSQREKTSTTITIKQLKNIDYRYTIERNGLKESTEIKASSTTDDKLMKYTIDGLDENQSYKITVEHRKSGEAYYSTFATELTIPVYRQAFSDKHILEMTGSSITVMEVKDNADGTTSRENAHTAIGNNATLLFYPDESGQETILETINITEDNQDITFDVSRLGVLNTGLFNVVISDSTGKALLYTEPKYFITPIVPIRNSINQKSITLSWTQPDEAEDIIYTISGLSDPYDKDGNTWKIPPTEVFVIGNKATLKLEDLVSNTRYHLTIEAELPNEECSTSSYDFTTESFAGEYRWVSPVVGGKVSSFEIEVWDKNIATEKIAAGEWDGKWNDDFPYHVLVHESDPAFTEEMRGVPIMPLFQGNDEIPEGTISYADGNQHYQIGYRWNEAKWNKTTKRPVKWKPTQNIISADHIESFCDSWPVVFGKEIQVSTKTTFEFRIKDGKAQLVFRNAGDGPSAGTVNIGLFTNPRPETGTDKYTFILDRIGLIK